MSDSAVSPNLVDAAFTKSFGALAHQQLAAAGLRGVAATSAAQVAAAPVEIYDTGGELLFHDYALHGADGSVVGTVRTAANRALGSPLISIAHGAPGWSAARALRLATEALHSSSPKAVVTGSRLVAYAYPKVGIELTFKVGETSSTELFDASSGAAVATSTEASHQFTRYSLLESLKPQAAARIKEFQAAEAAFAQIQKHPLDTGTSLQQATVLLSPYCPGSPVGLTHYAQITNYFCVDASAQMLLEHYGWNYTQNQIATAMGTTAAQGGTSGSGLTTGFKSLTDNTLLLSFDNGQGRAQQFVDAMTELNANRPVFTQVPHHYRVCVGYSQTTSEATWGPVSQMLYIYDPWPWNADLCSPGAAYWETWATSPVEWFGIVHHA